jgi:hypothetical protein
MHIDESAVLRHRKDYGYDRIAHHRHERNQLLHNMLELIFILIVDQNCLWGICVPIKLLSEL